MLSISLYTKESNSSMYDCVVQLLPFGNIQVHPFAITWFSRMFLLFFIYFLCESMADLCIVKYYLSVKLSLKRHNM